MEKGNNTLGLLIGAFVCLFLGFALIGVVADQSNTKTDYTPVNSQLLNINSAKYVNGATNTSIGFTYDTITTALTTWRSGLTSECDITAVSNSLRITNGTVTFTPVTDYRLSTTNGSITFQNTANVNGTLSNNTYVSYNYCPNDYVQGWAGNMLVLVPGFFALALLGCSIALFYSVAKVNGIF